MFCSFAHDAWKAIIIEKPVQQMNRLCLTNEQITDNIFTLYKLYK